MSSQRAGLHDMKPFQIVAKNTGEKHLEKKAKNLKPLKIGEMVKLKLVECSLGSLTTSTLTSFVLG